MSHSQPVYLVAADGEQDVVLGDLEARGQHGFEVSFITVLSKTGHFSRAGHLHPEHHVGSGQAREGELRNLKRCVVDFWCIYIYIHTSDRDI